MQQVEMPDMLLWGQINQQDGWVRLTCPEDFQVPAAVADEALRRLTDDGHRYEGIVADERTLYASIRRSDAVEVVGGLVVRKWLDLFTEHDPTTYVTTDEAWESFQGFWPRDDKVGSWMTKTRFGTLLTKLGHPSESARVGKQVLRVRPGLRMREVPLTPKEWNEQNFVPH